MKRLSIFVLLLLSVIRGVSQESEEEYQNDEEIQNEEEVQEENEEGQNNYFDIYEYFSFTNDEYANAMDKVNEMNADQQNVLYTLVVEVQKDKVLKDRLFRELITKPKKNDPFRDKDGPGFICVLDGLIENKVVYDAVIKNGSSEEHARNAAAIAERAVWKKCRITKKVKNF